MEQNTGSAKVKKGAKRERSSIVFPYGHLEDAIKVANAVYQLGSTCDLDQLADKLGHQTVSSGGFILRVSTARVFGVVEKDGRTMRLTDLGQNIVQPLHEKQAKVEAFLQVPLYRRVFDEYRGKLLPPDSGLENFMKQVGVAAKQANKARQALQRSARTAGFFDLGSPDKLILPIGTSESGKAVATSTVTEEEEPRTVELLERQVQEMRTKIAELEEGGGSVGKGSLLEGALTTLPEPKAGKYVWNYKDLDEWADNFRGLLKMVYRDEAATSSSNEPGPLSEQSQNASQE